MLGASSPGARRGLTSEGFTAAGHAQLFAEAGRARTAAPLTSTADSLRRRLGPAESVRNDTQNEADDVVHQHHHVRRGPRCRADQIENVHGWCFSFPLAVVRVPRVTTKQGAKSGSPHNGAWNVV